jgi:tetratricopeptide (TPR) repeat protein
MMTPRADQKRKLDAMLAAGRLSVEQHAELATLLAQVSPPRAPLATRAADLGDYLRTDGVLRAALYTLLTAILLLFTPYTHQLDEIKTALLFAVAPVLLLIALPSINFTSFRRRPSVPLLWLGAFVASNVLSFLLNLHTWRLGERLLWFSFALYGIAFLFAQFLDTPRKLRSAVRVFVLLGLGTAGIGLLMYQGFLWTAIYGWMNSHMAASPWTTLAYTLKMSSGEFMYSTILNSDFLAVFLVLLMPLTLASALIEERQGWKAVSLAAFALMALCLGYTKEWLTAYYGIAAVTIFVLVAARYVVPRLWEAVPRRALLTAAVIFVGILIVALVFVHAIPETALSHQLRSSRRVLWSGALGVWLHGDTGLTALNWKSLVLGSGPGSFAFYFPLYRPGNFYDYAVNNVTSSAHNYFLDLLCNNGLLGLSLFLAFAVALVRAGWHQITRSTDAAARVYQAGLLVGVCSGLVMLFSSPANQWTVVGCFFWALIGLMIAAQRTYTEETVRAMRQAHFKFTMPERWSMPALKLALASCALVFFVRSSPQGIDYWRAAVYNSDGLKYMDAAQDKPSDSGAEMLRKAEHLFNLAIQYNPTFATSYYKLGNVQNSLGDTDAAIHTYEKLNGIYPNYSELHLNLMIMYYVKYSGAKDPEEKYRLLRKSAGEATAAAGQSDKPNIQSICGDTFRELAKLEQDRGNTAERIALLTKARNCYRQVIEVNSTLAEVRGEKKKKLPAALQHIDEINKELETGANDKSSASAAVLQR